MDVYWRTTMPLLSTLAALVIIVHSAEENLEEYRRDLRPRVLESATTKYDLPWRAVKVEPMITQSTQTDTWDGSPEDPPKRRRPLRKRRRRPQGAPEVLSEKYTEQRQYRYYKEDNNRPLTEVPNRRRKKIDVKHDSWYEELKEKERPFRGKGIKRKPEQEPWHEFSEFGDVPVDENLETNVENQKHEISNYEVEVDNNESREPRLTLSQFYNEENNRNMDETADATDEENEESQFPINKENEYDERSTPEAKDEKSLSEFSLENSPPVRISRNKNEEQSHIKGNFNEIKEQKKSLDAVSLKDILKQSNGKSLSELLQQHNLTLSDLLNGEKKVLSVFKLTDLDEEKTDVVLEDTSNSNFVIKTDRSFPNTNPDMLVKGIDNKTEKIYMSSEEKSRNIVTYVTPEPVTVTNFTSKSSATEKYNINIDKISDYNNSSNDTHKTTLRRRHPTAVRMKLRMRPLNNSYKGQLSRDMITLTTKRYPQNKDVSKFREWKELIPAIINKTQTKWDISEEDSDTKTTTSVSEDKTTTQVPCEVDTINTQSDTETETEVINTDTTQMATIFTESATEVKTTTTSQPITPIRLRQRQNVTSLRQQAFANRLKNKKLKQKLPANETSQDNSMKDIFDMANLVSASEFIAKVQPSPTTLRYQTETETILEDFITTEIVTKTTAQITNKRSKTREKTKPSTASTTTKSPTISVTTTEEIAKMEIEEILNDTLTRAKLTKILMERNMTLNELVEHRERGSSHVHLADIFHNASKEPNPPEPFLSKSLIEPISKETYPLRALLEANSHESTMKPITVTTVPYISSGHYINIPIVMDFGNNVNENGENLGITSFINNFTGNSKKNYTTNYLENSPNLKHNNDLANEKEEKITTNRTSRQSRLIENEPDLITLNEIFSMIQKNHSNSNDTTEVSKNDSNTLNNKDVLEQNIDEDGLIVLEDFQHINQYDSSPSNEKMELKSEENIEATSTFNTPELIHSNTRSVTVVTASIVGLIAVLFLLTYAVFKWKHQQQMFRKKHSTNERIPSPVFEDRTINKNCSMRSMSPMLSSNIYAVNTLEKHNGNDCEYTWDSLRKPFQ